MIPKEQAIRTMLLRLPKDLRRQVPKLAIFEHPLSEKALLKITDLSEPLWSHLLSELIVAKMIEQREPLDNLKIIRFPQQLTIFLKEQLPLEQFSSLLERYCEYYFALSQLILTNRRSKAVHTLAKEELPNLERSLRLLNESRRWNIAVPFAQNLVHLQHKSSNLARLIEKVSVDSHSSELEQARKRRSVTFTPYSQRVENLRYQFGTPIVKVPWQMLAASNNLFADVIAYYKSLQSKNRHIRYDLDRLHKIYSLEPNAIYIGLDEFEGYVVFYFQKPQTAVLDCPIVGNAIYVIRGNWMDLSRLGKRDLVRRYPDKTRKIVHNGQWFERLMESIYGW